MSARADTINGPFGPLQFWDSGAILKQTKKLKGDNTMNLKPIKANMTELDLDRFVVLFSYKTPVAYFDRQEVEYFVTEKYWSRTTSRHITQWLALYNQTKDTAATIPQDKLDALLAGVK